MASSLVSTNRSGATEISSAQLCHTVCRFTAQPFRECHCYAITSAKVPLALYFCGGHFRECSIYQQHSSNVEKNEIDEQGAASNFISTGDQ